MAKRLYTGKIAKETNVSPDGTYTRKNRVPGNYTASMTSAYRDLRCFANVATNYIWTAYNIMGGNYVAVATIFVIVLLSFLLPDISQKIHVSKEINAVKKVLDLMSDNMMFVATMSVTLLEGFLQFLLDGTADKFWSEDRVKGNIRVLNKQEVNRAEAACLTVADEICYMHFSVRDGTTETSQDLRDLSVCTSSSLRATQSEPVQVEKKIGFFRRIFFPNRNTSHKEIAIMSYVYTNSFDAKKPSLNVTKKAGT